jgi:hypothetical protein
LSSHTLCLYGFGWHVAFGRNIARIENLQSLKIQKNANFRADTSTHQVSPANVSQLKCKCSQTKFVFTPIYSNYIRISIYMYIYIISYPYPIYPHIFHSHTFFCAPQTSEKKTFRGADACEIQGHNILKICLAVCQNLAVPLDCSHQNSWVNSWM